MALNFIVVADPRPYGLQASDDSWKEAAEHHMRQHLKDWEDIPDEYTSLARQLGDISFDWREEFESLKFPPYRDFDIQRWLEEYEEEREEDAP
jgi:hypothetical protein